MMNWVPIVAFALTDWWKLWKAFISIISALGIPSYKFWVLLLHQPAWCKVFRIFYNINNEHCACPKVFMLTTQDFISSIHCILNHWQTTKTFHLFNWFLISYITSFGFIKLVTRVQQQNLICELKCNLLITEFCNDMTCGSLSWVWEWAYKDCVQLQILFNFSLHINILLHSSAG